MKNLSTKSDFVAKLLLIYLKAVEDSCPLHTHLSSPLLCHIRSEMTGESAKSCRGYVQSFSYSFYLVLKNKEDPISILASGLILGTFPPLILKLQCSANISPLTSLSSLFSNLPPPPLFLPLLLRWCLR